MRPLCNVQLEGILARAHVTQTVSLHECGIGAHFLSFMTTQTNSLRYN